MAYIDDFGCEYSDDKKTFVRCPEDYKGHYTIAEGVTSIGDSAFDGCRGLTSVTIPDSVTSIGRCAFWNCSGLISVTIPNSVTSIGEDAFYGTAWLSNQPDGVIYINQSLYAYKGKMPTFVGVAVRDGTTQICGSAFDGCCGLRSITIPNSVTSIGHGAFAGTAWLENQPDGVIYINQSLYKYKGRMPEHTSIVVREGTTQICGFAFEDCRGLTSVTIPSSIMSIGDDAFSGCSGLTSITIPNSVTSIGTCAFKGCTHLISVTIPNSVTSIGVSAFSGCSGLTSITIPHSVTSIGDWAFSDCSGLTLMAVENGNPKYDSRDNCNAIIETATNTLIAGCQSTIIPNSVESIVNCAFFGCSGLTSVTIPNSVTSIGAYAFNGCTGLTSVTIGNSVTSIGDGAFQNCSGLTSVTILNSVTSIGTNAFSGCSGLTSITIPNSVTSIGEYAFKGCSGLTSVVWNAKKCEEFKDYYDAPFYNICSRIVSFTFGNAVEHIPAYLCCGMANLTSITIPNSVTSIGGGAFSGCSGLTSVTIPNSVTSIGSSAFSGCSSLTSITIPNSVTSIGTYAFRDCSALTSVTIGNSVTSIGTNAFSGCSGLTSVTIPNSVTSIGDGAFEDTGWLDNQPDGVIYINQLLYEYKGNMPANTSIVVRDGTTKICERAFKGCSGLTSVTIPNSVTSIGEWAFFGCSGLTSVTIPNSVMSIGYCAFSGCSGLTSVTIGNSVTSIGEYAFKGCSGLTSITIPNSVTIIKKSAFEGCSGLTSITIGNSVESIGAWAFSGCRSLTSITIPNSVTSIGNSAFLWCSGLTSVVWNAQNCADFKEKYSYKSPDAPFYKIAAQIISFTFGDEVEHVPAYLCCGMKKLTLVTISDSVTSIGDKAFEDCSGLTSVTIGNSVTNIGDSAFSGCSSLTSITIPNSVTSIGKEVFKGCSTLTSITFPNSVTNIGKCAFHNCSGLTSVVIGNSVESIDDYAFSGCSGLTSVTIPNSVTSIGEKAFEKCDALQTIFVPVGQKARFAAMGLPAAKIVERNNEKLQQLLTLAQVYEAGVIEPKDMAKAVRYYEGAIEEGSAEAAYHLGELYRNGKEVAADLQLAVNYFRKAADKHYKDAAQQLAACCEALERYNRQMEQFMHADEPQAEPYYLFFDTETNGLPRNYQAPISATDNWPRLIQIGWIVTDAEGNELQAGNHLVYPDGFTIPSDVERLTGISYSRARSAGKDLKEVLTEFMQQFNAVKHIVGHNIDFDLHIVGAELYRKNMPVNTILSKPYTCTMRSTIDFCQLPPFTYGSWKFPKLQELYHKLFGTQFAQAHDAMNDIRATQKCFFELKKRGII